MVYICVYVYMHSICMNRCHDTYMYDTRIHVQYLFTYVISMRVYVYHICIYTPHTQINVSSLYGCVAVCCSVLQGVAVCCSVLQCVAVCCSVLHAYIRIIYMYTCHTYVCSSTYVGVTRM